MSKEVEYLKEHLYEIYKYKKSMKDLTYDMDIGHLLRTCKALDYSQKEIERLNEELNDYEKTKKEYSTLFDENIKLLSENTRLKSIIKKAREKVDNFDVFKEFTFPLMKRDEEQQVKSSIDYEWRKSVKKPILEILDKVEEK